MAPPGDRHARLAAGLLAVFLLLLAADIGLWLYRDYRRGQPPLLAAAGPERHFDAIAVLAGGPGRIREGIRLWRRGLAPCLLIIGSNPRTSRRDIVNLFLDRGRRLDPAREAAIMIENRSRNTLANIRALRRLCRRHGFTSLVVVTSAFHLQRVYRLGCRLLPAALTVRYHPVANPGRTGVSRRTAAKEFLKYLAALPRVLDGR
ncbi:MAG: YdcF family protein [Deltaproteobacteria bacterium]|nr:YdcF family protein [Deltaproteobacteria bacterium]